MKLEDSKEALRKAEEATTNKKNNLGEALDNNKSKDKSRREDKRAKSPKKQRSRSTENKCPLPK